jgi:hypothetical protein
MSTTQYLNSDWIIYLGTDSYYYGKSGSSGKVLISGLVYNTVKNSITGSLSGTVFDDTLNRFEGYTTGVIQSYIDYDNAIYSGSSIIAANLTGSTAVITNVYVTNLTGSGTISGSTVAASTLSVGTFNPANIVATTITGSSRISGSTINATTISGSNIIIIGNISGSSITASYIPMKGYTNEGSPYTGSAINLHAGTNMTITGTNDYGYVTYYLTANTGSGEMPASYVLYSGSNGYTAQNGHTGVITSSASASTLLTYVLGTMPNGGTVVIKDGIFTAGNTVNIPYNNIGLIFENATWKILNGSGSGNGLSMFTAFSKNYIYINCINSIFDANIANQSPTQSPPGNAWITAFWITGSNYITVPNFKATGLGSNKCYGAGFLLDCCKYVNIGYAEGYDIGNALVSLEGSNYVFIDRLYTEKISQSDVGAATLEIWTWTGSGTGGPYYNATGSYITANSVITSGSGGYGVRIAGDYGSTHHVSIGQIITYNAVAGGLSIDSNVVNSGSVYAVSIGSVVSDYITGSNGRGVNISAATQDNIHHINIDSIYAKNISGSAGLYIYRAKNVHVGSIYAENSWYDGVNVENCNYCTIDNIRTYNCATSGLYDSSGVKLYQSQYCNISAKQIIDDRTPAKSNYAINEYAISPISDYNTYVINYASGAASGTLFRLSGSHSSLQGWESTGYASVANGGTIAHNLPQTPRWVSLNASGSNPLQFSYTVNATNITVYHTAGGAAGVFWKAAL